MESAASLSEPGRLQRIAGSMARLGAWRVDAETLRLDWSAEIAAIHEEPPGFSPTVEQGLGYYIPEHRDRIRKSFTACLEGGHPFDEVLQIVTRSGRRAWVRAIGEAVRDAVGKIVAVEGAFQDVTELVLARDEAEALSRRLRQTLESISDAFFLLDDQWRFSFLNSQAETLLQRPRQELLGRGVWDEFPEAVGTTFQVEYERAMRERRSVRIREWYPPLQRWFDVDAYPTTEGLAVYFRDVTQEQAREEQLRLLGAAVARLNDILLITEAEPVEGPEGPRIVYVNDSFVRLTGYSRAEVIGRTPRLLQGPRTQRAELDRIRESLKRWQPVRCELINYTKSGEEFWLELDIVPLANADGWYTHWVAVQRDVTERKRAEQAVRISDERFQLLAQATNDVIWDWDLAGGTVWWNENLTALSGDLPGAIEPGPEFWMKRIHPDDRDRVLASIDACIAGSEANWTCEYRFLRADGVSVVVVDRALLIRDAEGRALRMVGSMTNITEQRDMETRLRQAQKLEAVGQLTGGIAHDFNNLLTVILGNAETLQDALKEGSALRPLAAMICAAAERGAELNSRLLAFSRKQSLRPRAVDVNALLRNMEALLRRALPEHIDIRSLQGQGLGLTEVDPGQLETAILNLAVNARDAMPEGGCLTIETTNAELDEEAAASEPDVLPGAYVVIAVTDTGSGIPGALIGRIFEPFFTTKEVGKGTGLGLSMVYGFVKQSGGHVRVYSEAGQGTTIKLYLPRSQGGAARQGTPQRQVPAAGGSERILAVEDDDLVREHLVARLKGLGYAVFGAGNGGQALEILRREPGIDLLLTDVVMPGGMNGRELANRAREIRPGLRVLFTSGYTENAIVHHGRLDPDVEILSKPYRREQLAAKVRAVLDRQS